MKFASFHLEPLSNDQSLRYRLMSMHLATLLRDRSTPLGR
jgi:hypothetical protein